MGRVQSAGYIKKEKYERNTNHELLRMVAMYMIVFIHSNMYLSSFCTGKWFSIFNGVVNGLCNTGVTCFILISGYYGMKFDVRKLIRMECMMITYSLFETLVYGLVFPEQMAGTALLEGIVKAMLPFVTRKYWFYSCYVCVFLFSGFIQKFIDSMEQAEFRRLLLLMTGLFSVLPTIFYFEIIPDNGKGLVQMLMIYLMGRYIRIYRDISLPKGKAMLLFMILWIINGVSHELPIQLGGMMHHLCKDNSITNVIMAILLFYLFKDLKFHSRFINRISGYVFAIFALNNTLVEIFMETVIKKIEISRGNGPIGFVLLCVCVLVIYLVCLVVGGIRECLLGRCDRKMADLGLDLIGCKEIGRLWEEFSQRLKI